MKKITAILAATTAAALNTLAADPLDADWKEYEAARDKRQDRTATNVLTRIESKAEELKRWPDLAAAFMFRSRIEYGFTEENALDAEKAQGLVAKYAANVDAMRPEVRPMLRLALAHDYLSMRNSHRFWREDRTKLENATNEPPWSAERITDTVTSLINSVAEDREKLLAEKVTDWQRLLSYGEDYADLCRPTLWDFALNDAVDLVGRVTDRGRFYDIEVAEEKIEENPINKKIVAWLDELIAAHEKAGRTDAQAYAIYRKIQLTYGDKTAFAEEWFDKSSVSALAAHEVAMILSQGDGDERIKAHAITEKYYNRWPKSPGGHSCLNLMKSLERPHFSLQVENQLLSKDEKITISSRNLSKLFFRMVPVDFKKLTDEPFVNMLRGYNLYDNSELRKLVKSKATAVWTADINDAGNYVNCRNECDIPANIPNGYYVIFAASNDKFGEDDLPVQAVMVSRSDLFLSMTSDNNGWRGFVFDADTGKPQNGVDVEFWIGSGRGYKFLKKATTEVDGSWSLSADDDNRYGLIRAVRNNTGTMFKNESWWYGHDDDRDNFSHIDIVTDRAIYRPGQKVLFKGYFYYANPNKRDFHVQANQKVRVAFKDPNGKDVDILTLTSNDFGTFSGEFTSPRDRLTGNYTIEVQPNSWSLRGTTSVSVEEYKRPKFTAKFDNAEGLELGKETTLVGRAITYTGLPVAKAKVKWEIKRRTIYPYWCWWCINRNDDDVKPIASGEAETDDNGEFKCTFTPQATKDAKIEDEPRFSFTISANVTDASGEMHAAGYSFTVGVVPWSASISSNGSDDEWKMITDGTKYHTWLKTADGNPVANVEGEVKAYSLKAPDKVTRKPLREYYYGRWHYNDDDNFDDPNYYQANKPETWSNDTVIVSAKVKTNEKGEAEGMFKLQEGVYRLEYITKTPEGITVRDEKFVRVIDPSAKKYSIREPFFSDFEKSTVRVGDTARLFFGTGYDTANWRIKVTQGSKTLLDEARTGNIGVVEFPVKDEHRGYLAFEIIYERENRLYHEQHTINVPWNEHVIKVTRECMTSKLLPDATETWRFRITGENTNEVRRGVEALALMFDKSLDVFRHHHPYINFDRHFSLPTVWTSWNYPNEPESFRNWRGNWTAIPGSWGISWRKWGSDALGIFDTVGGGWRGGYRMAGVFASRRSMKSMAVEDGVCYDMAPAVAECAAVDEEAGEPLLGTAMAAAPVGKMAVGGARMRKENKGMAEDEPEAAKPDPEVEPRKNLQETAFFMPSLVSDENGIVEFSFKVPQALTGWKFFILANGKDLSDGGMNADDIVTVKPLMVEPNAPRFAREGDDFLFPVKVSNTSDKAEKGSVVLEFFNAENGKPELEKGRLDFELAAGESKTYEFHTNIPDGCGYLRYVAKAAGAEFTDGEEGFLPVLSKRIMVQESMPLQIRKKGEKKFHFEKLEKSGESDTLRHVGLAAQVVSDPTWYAFLALPYLMEYPHECNEQTFSRYYANALAAKIANSDPAYKEMFLTWEKDDANALRSPLELNEDLKSIILDATPWVKDAADETRARRHIGELFGSARLEAEQARAIEKLKTNIDRDGLWPWFPGGRGSVWVSMHILTGFARLKTLGIDTLSEDRNLQRIAEKARNAIDKEMVKSIDERLASPFPFVLCDSDLRWLYLQSFDGSWNKKHEKLLFKHLAAEWTKFSIAGESLGAIVALRHGDKQLAKDIVKSLKERAVRSEEFGLYWKRNPFFDCSLYAAPVSDQAVAMEAFLAVEPEDIESYDDARLWMLEQKRTQNWSSTVSTVDAVYAILLGRGKGAPVKVGPVTMKLGESEVPRENMEAGTGFYECRYDATEIKPAMGEITLSREEDALGWASVSWTYLEDATKITNYEEKDIRVTKTYFKKTRVNGKIRLVALDGGEKLLPGDELVSRITIDSNRIYEYVHLKDERPASAEPVDVISYYHWQDGLGYYQSTRDTATHFYFDRLPKGNFVLETSYRVRQKGVFSSGLATIECMYAPEFGAHSNASVIKVE